MDDLVHSTRRELAETAARRHADRAQKAIDAYHPEEAVEHLREAARELREIAAMETLGSVTAEYTAKADEYDTLADALGAEGMSALEASDGADASVARDGATTADEGLPIEVQTPAVTFHDVGGLEGVKQLLIEKVADPIRRDELYAQYGIEPVRGVLLQGPPGTGKTLLARALGGELGWSFIELSPAQLTSALVGRGAQNIQDVFTTARAHEPCIVFFDEIENIAKDRTSRTQSTRSEESMLIQLLTEMNDLDDADVVVIGATNQPEEVDDALRNARRFAEVVEVPPPDAPARRAILAVHLRTPSVPLQDIDLDAAAAATDGFAGDDLEQVVMNAARAALREAEETGTIVPIGQRHLQAGIDERAAALAEAAGGGYIGGGHT